MPPPAFPEQRPFLDRDRAMLQRFQVQQKNFAAINLR